MRKMLGVLVAAVWLAGLAWPTAALAFRGHGHVRAFHGHTHVFHGGPRAHVFIGVGPRFWWGPPWPYYAYPYPYYPEPLVIERQPDVYVQQQPPAPQPYYWYYCEESKTYYPYVQQCPGGWKTVVPPTSPPQP